MTRNNWFEVSKDGLHQAFGENGLTSLMFELIQNSLDAGSKKIVFDVTYDRRHVHFWIVDDGNGISDLSAIYTVFGNSTSKNNPEKRGRFCIGDKLVLARCENATVESTTGTVCFDASGRHKSNKTRAEGTRISGTMKCSKEEFSEFHEKIFLLIAPEGVIISYCGRSVGKYDLVTKFIATLPTIISDEEGVLKKSQRQTEVQLYETKYQQAMIYEMGIPVCEANCPYHVNIGQKIPLSMDRDKLPESFLKTLHALVLNATVDKLDDRQFNTAWVAQATASKVVSAEAMKTFMDKSFSEERVSFDPTDVEANNRATANDHKVVYGGSLSGEQWENVRRFELIKPAGKVFPTAKPFSPDGKPLQTINPADYTQSQKDMVHTANFLAENLIGKPITVFLTDDKDWKFGAAYGNGSFPNEGTLFISVISHPQRNERWLDMIVHEFGHDAEGNHLSEKYHQAITKIAAKLARLVLNQPSMFAEWLK